MIKVTLVESFDTWLISFWCFQTDFKKSSALSMNVWIHTLKLNVGILSKSTWAMILKVFRKCFRCSGGFREKFHFEPQCMESYIGAQSGTFLKIHLDVDITPVLMSAGWFLEKSYVVLQWMESYIRVPCMAFSTIHLDIDPTPVRYILRKSANVALFRCHHHACLCHPFCIATCRKFWTAWH